MIRPRLAPRALRTASSLSRVAARANSSRATLLQTSTIRSMAKPWTESIGRAVGEPWLVELLRVAAHLRLQVLVRGGKIARCRAGRAWRARPALPRE